MTRHSWSCGDGGCSDSGITFRCYDREENKAFCCYDWESNKCWGHCMDNALIFMWEKLSREPVRDLDYDVDYYEENARYGERKSYESEFTYHKD